MICCCCCCLHVGDLGQLRGVGVCSLMNRALWVFFLTEPEVKNNKTPITESELNN